MKKFYLLIILCVGFISCTKSQVKITSPTHATYDAVALAYCKAENITLDYEKQAINSAVFELKSYGLWNTAVLQCYPMLGAYQTHSLIDTNVKLIPTGTWNVDALLGSNGNGTTGYAKTTFTPATSASSDVHVSYYLGTDVNTGATQIDIGCASSGSNFWVSSSLSASSLFYMNLYDYTATQSGGTNGNTKGYYCMNLLSGTSSLDRNGATVATFTNGGYAKTTTAVYLGAFNNVGTATNFTSRQFRWVTLGNGLTAQNKIDLEKVCYNYQMALNRGFRVFDYFYGDSYTFGAYTGRTWYNTWTALLDSITGRTCVNNGISGLAVTQHRVSGNSIDSTGIVTYGPRCGNLYFTFSTDNEINQALTVAPFTNTIANMDTNQARLIRYTHNTKNWSTSRIRIIAGYYQFASDSAVHYPWQRGLQNLAQNLGLKWISNINYQTAHGGDANIQANINHPSLSPAQINIATNVSQNE